jgi:hypothetical protein
VSASGEGSRERSLRRIDLAKRHRGEKTRRGFFRSGQGEIRTPDTGDTRIQHFQCCSFNRSDTCPEGRRSVAKIIADAKPMLQAGLHDGV